jgi:hypothetical protein
MKCAMEILMIKEEADVNYAIEQAKLDEQCKIKHKLIIAETIKFCEEVISPAFEELAKNRKELCYTLSGGISSDRLNNQLFSPLIEGERYGNRGLSYKPSTKVYDVKTMEEYLIQFCYSVKWSEMTYMRYGWGYQKGKDLIVTI